MIRSRFHDPLVRSQDITGNDREAGDGNVQGYPFALSGLQGNPLKGDQLPDRAQYRTVLTVRVNLDDFVTCPLPGVGYGDRDAQFAVGLDGLRHLEVFIAEAGVAQPVPEGKQGIVGSPGWMVVEGGHLADPLRPRGSQFAAGVGVAEEDVRHSVTPSVPGR